MAMKGTVTKRSVGRTQLAVLFVLTLLCIQPMWGALGGSVSGTVSDPNGLAVTGASVTAINTATNVRQTITSNSAGVYSFPELEVGTYEIRVEAKSFRGYHETNLVVDTDSKLRVDAALVLGDQRDSVTVAATAARVDTVDTQLGEVISGSTIVAV